MDRVEGEPWKLAKREVEGQPGLPESIQSLLGEVERQVAETLERTERNSEAIRRAAFRSAERILVSADALEGPLRDLGRMLQYEFAAREEASRMQAGSGTDGFLARLTGRGRSAEAARRALADAEAAHSAARTFTDEIFRQVDVLGEHLANLDQTVRTELSHSHIELAGYLDPPEEDSDSPSAIEPHAAEAQPAPEPEPTPEPEPEPTPHTAPNGSASSTEPEPPARYPGSGRKQGIFSRFKERTQTPTFVRCSICGETPEASTTEYLAQNGWLTSGDAGLCPDCQKQGWELPEGAPLPFSRGVT